VFALRSFRAAVVFLTRVPIGGFPYSDAEWRWCTAFFPLVGACIGVVLAAVWPWLAPLGAVPAAIIVVAASLLITGGFHEDGLADTADALGGAHSREQVFDILKDSRIGTFGALALIVSLSLRIALLAALGDAAPVALVVSECASRLPPIWLMASLPYVTRDDQAKSRLVTRAGAEQAALALLWTALVLYALVTPGQLAVSAVLGIAIASVLGRWFRRRVGGVTGDFLGATQQIVCWVLLAMLAW